MVNQSLFKKYNNKIILISKYFILYLCNRLQKLNNNDKL